MTGRSALQNAGPKDRAPVQQVRRPRRGLLLGVVALVVVASVGAGWWGIRRGGPAPPPTCTVSDGPVRYRRPAAQVLVASDLAAVGVRMRLPDHAITVVLAAAMQESRLRNLPGGDRDSVGVLQQRPSQGWGRRDELLDPSFAVAAFYQRLLQVSGWEQLDVTAAAQAVQRSGRPGAYRQWESEARALAKAFTGETPAALTCTDLRTGPNLPAGRVAADEKAALGGRALGASVATREGWASAAWVVAHAGLLGVTAVSFAGQRWTSEGGSWAPTTPARPVVTFTPS